jgi:chromosome partitioning protein
MAVIIAVAQRKGGVGKTTLAVSVAGELGKRGWDIALIDSDAQHSASQWAEPGNLHFPVYQIGLVSQAISTWANHIKAVQADYLVIDTAPNEREMAASVALCDLILVPCTASGLDLEATSRTLSIIQAVRNKRKAPLRVILVPNRVDRRTLEGRQLVEELQTFGEPVGPPIANRSAFVRAFSTGQSVGDFAAGQPADLEIRNLCDLVQRVLPRRQETSFKGSSPPTH